MKMIGSPWLHQLRGEPACTEEPEMKKSVRTGGKKTDGDLHHLRLEEDSEDKDEIEEVDHHGHLLGHNAV